LDVKPGKRLGGGVQFIEYVARGWVMGQVEDFFRGLDPGNGLRCQLADHADSGSDDNERGPFQEASSQCTDGYNSFSDSAQMNGDWLGVLTVPVPILLGAPTGP